MQIKRSRVRESQDFGARVLCFLFFSVPPIYPLRHVLRWARGPRFDASFPVLGGLLFSERFSNRGDRSQPGENSRWNDRRDAIAEAPNRTKRRCITSCAERGPFQRVPGERRDVRYLRTSIETADAGWTTGGRTPLVINSCGPKRCSTLLVRAASFSRERRHGRICWWRPASLSGDSSPARRREAIRSRAPWSRRAALRKHA